jgi:hypothetical protein
MLLDLLTIISRRLTGRNVCFFIQVAAGTHHPALNHYRATVAASPEPFTVVGPA